jgi:hypothetical protein
MAIKSAVCDSFVTDYKNGKQTASDLYKIALYSPTLCEGATFDNSTTTYTTTNEIISYGYINGGQTIKEFKTYTDKDYTVITFTENPKWSGIDVNLGGAMIYNASKDNASVAVFSFMSDEFPNGINPAGGDFEMIIPAPTANAGLIVIPQS